MRFVLFFVVAITAASCTRVVFDVPQPRDTAFPGDYLGAYLVDNSQDSLIISRSGVTFTEYREEQVSLDAVDTLPHLSIRDNLIYNSDFPQIGGVPYTIEDTLLKYAFTDRHFIGISDTFVIKKSKAYLVVSAKFTEDKIEDYWDVYLVQVNKSGNLIASSTGNLKTPDSENQTGKYDGDLAFFNKITPYERLAEDTYLFRPSKKEFQKLVKKGLFSDDEIYLRVR